MSLSRVKNWIAGEVLTASDLNTEFSNILNNPGSLICPIGFNLTFTDATYDIGASGATRPRDYFGSRDVTVGRQLLLSGAAAGQIVFPAAQNASSDANTLDDYEEGTWNPSYSGSGGAAVYTKNSGFYEKVGRKVTCTFITVLSNVNTLTGSLVLVGLPFAIANDSAYQSTGSLFFDTMTTSIISLIARVNENSSTANMYFRASAGVSLAALQASDLANTTTISGSFTYLASA